MPQGAAPGWYAGTVHVTGGITVDVPVKLYVHAFTLPSTSSLPSAYGIGWNDTCTAHYGGYTQCGGDPGVQAHQQQVHPLRARPPHLAVRGRLQRPDAGRRRQLRLGVVGRDVRPDARRRHGRHAPAAPSSPRCATCGPNDQAHYAEWAKHFRAKGWFDRTFDYSCDEPPAGCSWSSINTRTAMVHAADPQLHDAGDDAARARPRRTACSPASTCWCRR